MAGAFRQYTVTQNWSAPANWSPDCLRCGSDVVDGDADDDGGGGGGANWEMEKESQSASRQRQCGRRSDWPRRPATDRTWPGSATGSRCRRRVDRCPATSSWWRCAACARRRASEPAERPLLDCLERCPALRTRFNVTNKSTQRRQTPPRPKYDPGIESGLIWIPVAA